MSPPSTPSLLSANFVRELETLRRRLEIQARSGGPGSVAARRRGGAAEFLEHRAYAPGDDLRRVDWLAFARTGEPMVKTFRSEEDATVHLLLDCSASLGFGTPTKLDVIRRLAAAIGYMALAESERVQVISAGGNTTTSSRPMRALSHIGPPRRGRAALAALLRELTITDEGGPGDLSAAIDRLSETTSRPGLLVVLSDFFDSGPVTRSLARARAKGHSFALIQVLTRDEVSPVLEGDLTLVDSETGALLDVTMDPAAIDAYVLRFVALVDELRSFARKHGGVYVRTLNEEPMEGAVRRFVARSID